MNNGKPIYTVRQINLYIKQMVDTDPYLRNVFVKGEVSNCKYHYSGHVYFSLKDESGVISVIMFASNASRMTFRLRDGMQVVAGGSISVYERDGKYQLYARNIEETGTGELFRKYEALKNTLCEMGMFSEEYKRPIPKFSTRIGVVTAQTGAVIRDIYNVASRRNPYCSIILAPAQVQGAGAAESICAALKRLDRLGLDVIIAGRGGGSIEDLWCFNEESVARAIFDCKTPVISAVGHETDFTIADFVADLRAPTPSAAAELAVFDYYRFTEDLKLKRNTLRSELENILTSYKDMLEKQRLRLEALSPASRLSDHRHRIQICIQRLSKRLAELKRDNKARADMDALDLDSFMERIIEGRRRQLGILSERLNGVSPLKRIAEGYAFISDSSGRRIGSISQVKLSDQINIDLADGILKTKIEEIIERNIGE